MLPCFLASFRESPARRVFGWEKGRNLGTLRVFLMLVAEAASLREKRQVVKKVQIAPPVHFSSEPIASKEDKLGPLLRMYSELSTERKQRAFDFIAQLHALEQPGQYDPMVGMSGSASVPSAAPPAVTATVGGASSRRGLRSPPPPPSTSGSSSMMGRPRPPPVAAAPHLEALITASTSGQTSPELRVTLTADQLRRLGETLAPHNNSLDGFSSVFTPGAPMGVQSYAVPPSAPPTYPTGLISPLRRQHRQAGFGTQAPSSLLAGESVYSMLSAAPPPPPPSYAPPVSMYAAPPAAMYEVPPAAMYAAPPSTSYVAQPLPATHGRPHFQSAFQQPQPALLPPAPVPYCGYAEVPPALERELTETRERVRNLQINMAAYPGDREATGSVLGGGGEVLASPSKPFMQSLTSMHQGMSPTEINLAERKRREWLRDLDTQVRAKEGRKAAERAEKEIEDLKEELRYQQMRAKAEEALRASLAAGAKE